MVAVAIVVTLFALVWFGVAILSQTPNEAMLVSAITIILIGAGIRYSRSTLRSDRGE
jgi:hypothetical protein